jgi:hypothetical protein
MSRHLLSLCREFAAAADELDAVFNGELLVEDCTGILCECERLLDQIVSTPAATRSDLRVKAAAVLRWVKRMERDKDHDMALAARLLRDFAMDGQVILFRPHQAWPPS